MYYARAFCVDGETSNENPFVGFRITGQQTFNDFFNYEETFVVKETSTLNLYIYLGYKSVYTNYKLGIVLSAAPNIDKYYEYVDYDTYTIDWTSIAGTIYGWDLDATTGKLTVDHDIVDMGSLTWSAASGGVFSALINDRTTLGRIYSDAYRVVDVDGAIDLPAYSISGNIAGKRVYVKDSRYSTAAAFTTAVTGYKIVYELTTPVEYNVTPIQITALAGQNVLWNGYGKTIVEDAQDPTVVMNPTPFNSKPQIKVTGYGTLTIGDDVITISNTYNYVLIDCDLEDCTYEGQNANAAVSFTNNDFPEFEPGAASVSYSNTITKVEITPNWYMV